MHPHAMFYIVRLLVADSEQRKANTLLCDLSMPTMMVHVPTIV